MLVHKLLIPVFYSILYYSQGRITFWTDSLIYTEMQRTTSGFQHYIESPIVSLNGSINMKDIDKLVKSLPSSTDAVLEARGDPTPY